jgi:hemerythrin
MEPQPMHPNTAVFVLDDQHQVLFEWLSRLEEAMRKGEGASMVPQLLEKLSKYIDVHFGTEEQLMQSLEYPLAAMHGLEHQKARLKLQEAGAWQGNNTAAVRLLEELHEWLDGHIPKWDAMFEDFLRAKGVPQP